jgi:hypothetical protein
MPRIVSADRAELRRWVKGDVLQGPAPKSITCQKSGSGSKSITTFRRAFPQFSKTRQISVRFFPKISIYLWETNHD